MRGMSEKRSEHECRFSVRGYEIDSFGHVNNAVYMNYFEHARWEALRSLGLFDYFAGSGHILVVAEASIRYSREAKVFDELVCGTDIAREAPYLVFKQSIRNVRDGGLIARGSVKTILVDRDRVPLDIPEFFPGA